MIASELIVHPTLQFDDIAAFFKRLDVLIIGPGNLDLFNQ